MKLLLITITLLFSAVGLAAELTIPNTFSAGQPALASEMNANFTAVETAVDDNAARVTTLEQQVTTLQQQVTALLNPSQSVTGVTYNLISFFGQQYENRNAFYDNDFAYSRINLGTSVGSITFSNTPDIDHPGNYEFDVTDTSKEGELGLRVHFVSKEVDPGPPAVYSDFPYLKSTLDEISASDSATGYYSQSGSNLTAIIDGVSIQGYVSRDASMVILRIAAFDNSGTEVTTEQQVVIAIRAN